MKELYRPPEVPKAIKSIRFHLAGEADIEGLAQTQIIKYQLYSLVDGNRKGLEYGPLDPQLGATKRGEICSTCKLDHQECIGHWGYIDLPLPIFHTGYLWHIVKILQCICKNCARVMIPEKTRARYLPSATNENLEYIQKKMLRKILHKSASRTTVCPFCHSINGIVKKGTGLSYIVHDYSKSYARKLDKVVEPYTRVAGPNNDLLTVAKKCVESIRPYQALELFSKIPTEDLPLLLMPFSEDKVSHPRNLIVERVLVPPNAIRPSVISEVRNGTNEDDLTQILQWILSQAATLEEDLSESEFITHYDNLHAEFTRLINSQTSGLPPIQDQKFIRGILQRLATKHGRFRLNLLGKRTNYTARTVISPDPNLRIDEVCIPEYCAIILTYPERVTEHNIEFLRKLVLNGPYKYPGAVYLNYKSPDSKPGEKAEMLKKFLSHPKVRESSAKSLRVGDIVDRHLIEGDIILFNRQPSLHRVSMQAFKAVVKPHRTFRFNPCCCTPFNADFDGDEMNVHLPQTEEARAEAKYLMLSLYNIANPKNGEPLISPIQDMITACYLFTLKDTFFEFDKACDLAAQLAAGSLITQECQLPPPAIVWPVKLWTGKQIFSLIMSPHPSHEVKINLRVSTKAIYSGNNEEMCPNDGFVVIYNSELLAGCMDKKLLGSGSKSSIFYSILRDYGGEACADAMWRLSRIALYYLSHRGFSIGIEDVTPDELLVQAKQDIIKQGYATCDDYINQYETNTLACNPGCSMEETLEMRLSQVLSRIRDEAGSACKRSLYRLNAALVMALIGSKGSLNNISQMCSCVGQQIIAGHRVPDSLNGERSIVLFHPGSRTPNAKGFVSNSFYSGLTAYEFFFHAMSGREGLTDTAVKTADTGYMQRRIVKFLEDLTVTYDGTVRDSRDDIVQFKYGSDGFDPCEMEVDSFPVDFDRELINVKAHYPCRNESSLTPDQVKNAVSVSLKMPTFADVDPIFPLHINEFFDEEIIPKMLQARQGISSSEVLTGVMAEPQRLTNTQLRQFLMSAKKKFDRALIEPSTAVGAICGQSIGEPATQMTLQTFHFAGVASMNITQGVPRMREIVNAVANIHTPLLTVQITDPTSAVLARRVKMSIEPTQLADIALMLRQMLTPDKVYVLVEFDQKRMIRREITPRQVAAAVRSATWANRKVKIIDIVWSESQMRVYPEDLNKLELLVQLLENVVVKGIKGVTRVVIQQDKTGHHNVYVEGAKFREVMAVQGVVPELVRSNNILEVECCLGVEAARRVVMEELCEVMAAHGVTVNIRHVMLLADLMTNRGEVYGYQRSGMAKAKNSVLCLASFERTGDHLFEAAYHSQEDNLAGITESIIVGNPARIGTGTFDLLGK
ncbi:unnamed protein product [Hymenolepis diminuta]|uniref:DNA-directed RNA polymerase subunit n=1 Tax=Hymenolepis diminuta TaxID=6216 RepID=A0A0R3SDQ0_HYMDI|nr:unnamed protein product [Hymenolepis diminuta]